MPDHPIDLNTIENPAELKQSLDMLEAALENYDKILRPDIFTADKIIKNMNRLGVYGFLDTIFDPVLNEI
jgi:hypothetical protein